MANNKKPEANVQGEKKMTKYDRKMQFRKEQAALAKKRAARNKGIAAVCAIAIIAGVGYKVYSDYQKKHGPYIAIGEHEIMKSEVDYYANIAFNNFYTQYGSYASYFGLDLSQPLNQQYYSPDLTWVEYFEQSGVERMSEVYALYDAGKAAGFEFDTTDSVARFAENIEHEAGEQDMTVADYVKTAYGDDATLDLLKSYVETSSYSAAYYNSVEDATEVSEDEISTYYLANKEDYDLVDYLSCEIKADIPEVNFETEEGEELTDEQQEAIDEQKQQLTDAAMAEAKITAETMLGKVKDEASFEKNAKKFATNPDANIERTGVSHSDIYPADLAAWLYDDAREAGDTTVIEYTANDSYYVVMFQDRKINDAATVNARHILVTPEEIDTEDLSEEEVAEATDAALEAAKAEAEAIFDEWKAGEATEESFGELAKAKSQDTGSVANGGLYTNVAQGDMVEEFNDWIFDENRKAGDCEIVQTTYGYHIIYFVGEGDVKWHGDINSTLVDQKMTDYLEEIKVGYDPVEKNGTLKYLHIEEETEAAVEDEETESETETETEE